MNIIIVSSPEHSSVRRPSNCLFIFYFKRLLKNH